MSTEANGSPSVPDPAALARDALTRGHAALAAGNPGAATRWLDRACRLAPGDHTLSLTLAATCLAADPARAATLFGRVAQSDDVREAWFGLAGARLRLGDPLGAADALAQALHRHSPGPTLVESTGSLADEVVRAAGAPGWCGLCADGRLVIRTREPGTPRIEIDGRRSTGPALPPAWEQSRSLTVQLGRHSLVGSPIDIGAIRRCTGFVEADNGGLRGWAWCPGDPDLAPALLIRPAQGNGNLHIIADLPVEALQDAGALARPRGFAVAAEALAGMSGLLHVCDGDGRELTGSPLDPNAEQRATAAATKTLARLYPAGSLHRPAGRSGRNGSLPMPPPAMPADVVGSRPPAASVRPSRQPADVVIPVYNGLPALASCLESVLFTVQPPSRIVVVDDASTDPEVAVLLQRFIATGRFQIIRQPHNAGFPAAANAGIAACPDRDVVLLNSDTLLPPRWLEQLHDAAWSAPDIGTATPLSNHGSVLSYPGAADHNKVPTLDDTIELARHARAANPDITVDIPVGIGFCLYVRRDCLNEVGGLRTDVFAQGYGEENDFSLRARHLGWRHVAVPGLFVGHIGGASFGLAGRHLQRRNERLLNRLHPGYAKLVQGFLARDPLAEARRRLDLQRWKAGRGRAGQSAILITHDQGGGVERQIANAVVAHRAADRRPIVLRPARTVDGTQAVLLSEGADDAFPNLRFTLPDELGVLLRLLKAERPKALEVHHLLGYHPAIHTLIARLGIPYRVHIHDYAWFCPRVALVNAERRYCGEPNVTRCEACVADAGSLIKEEIGVQPLRDRSGRLLTAAERVVTPSHDTASRMRRHFPGLRPVVVPHEADGEPADPPAMVVRAGSCRVCLLGAIGLHKGYDVLLACARDAAERRLPLEFVVVGHTIDDARLMATGRAFVTGEYQPDEAVDLIVAQQATLGFVPSIAPETWSLGLTELWRAGLRVAAFDIGAPAERIRATGRGMVLPLGLPPAAINNALVAAAGLSVHEGGRPAV